MALILAPSEFVGHVKFIKILKKSGIKISNVLDVGAYKGTWTKVIKRNCLRNAKFYLIEPNSKYLQDLNKLGTYYECLVSNEIKDIDFYQLQGTGDSYYKEVGDVYKNVKPIRIRSETLDSLNLPKIDLVKIDTQGSEIDILSGFISGLKFCKAIILELPVTAYNLGSPNFSECIDSIANMGFVPAYLIDQHIVKGELKQLDIGFVRQDLLKFISPSNKYQKFNYSGKDKTKIE